MVLSASALLGHIERSAEAAAFAQETDVVWSGVRIRVEHDSTELAAELSDRLQPYFTVQTPAIRSKQATYRIRCVRTHIGRPAGHGTRFYLRFSADMPDYSRAATRYDVGNSVVIVDDEARVGFTFRKGSHRVTIGGPGSQAVAKATRRIVQDLVRVAAWANGVAIIEASAVAVAGQGAVVMAGTSMAGKTVLLTRLLQIGLPAFMSNDEVMLDTTVNPVNVWGAPVHVMVRSWLAQRTPELRDVAGALRISGAAKQSVHYPDFARRFGATLCRDAPLAALLFIEAGEGVRPASNAETRRRLAQCRLWDDQWDTPWRAVGKTPYGQLTVANILSRLASNSCAFVVGRDTAPAAVLELISHPRRELPCT